MLQLTNFIHTKTGRVLMSILLGLGLSTFFRRVCKGKRCVIMRAPPQNEMDGKVYKYGEQCYKTTLTAAKCDPSKKTVTFA